MFGSRIGVVALVLATTAAGVAWTGLISYRRGLQTRSVHLELFRYGASPCVIRARRGDRLVMTFSTRDTGHSFFLQEYRIDAKVTPGGSYVEVFDPLHPERGGVRKRSVMLVVGRPGVWGRLCSKWRFHCHVYCGPLHGFEQGDLIAEPNWLYGGALGFLFGLPLAGICRILRGGPRSAGAEGRGASDGGHWTPLLRWTRLIGNRRLQIFTAEAMLAGLYLVILAGFLGTSMPGRNLAVMGVWGAWLFLLTVILVPLGGRLWCWACPLPFLGDMFRRRPPRRSFPAVLRTRWSMTLLFLVLGTFSPLLVTSPFVTAVVLALTLGAATFSGLFFREEHAFCRWLCPVNAFLSLYARCGVIGVRVGNPKVCARCRAAPCRNGSHKGRACAVGLRASDISRNDACSFCGECFRTCPHDNVRVVACRFAQDTGLDAAAEAFQACILFTLALVYCIVHQGPQPWLRDLTDLVDKKRWDLFLGAYVPVVWGTALALFPSLLVVAGKIGGRWAGVRIRAREALVNNAASLVPFGLFLWIAFALMPVMVHGTFILVSLSDPFGWNWDLFGTAGLPWRQVWPSGIPWLQTAAVLAGVGYGLRSGYRAWRRVAADGAAALRAFAPAAVVLLAVGAGMVRFFADSWG